MILTFKIGNGEFVEDEAGNPVEITQDLIVKASVRVDKELKDFKIDGQIGSVDILLIGRCVEPKLLPNSIDFEKPADAILIDHAVSGQEITGVFRFTPTIQHRSPLLVKALGMKIEGKFNTTART